MNISLKNTGSPLNVAHISIVIAFTIVSCCIVVVVPCMVVNLIIWRNIRNSKKCSKFCGKINDVKKNTTLGFWCFLIIGIVLLPFLLIVYCVSCKCFGDIMECCFEITCDLCCDLLFSGNDTPERTNTGIVEQSDVTNSCNVSNKYDIIQTQPITARLQTSVDTDNGLLYYTMPISKRVFVYPKKEHFENYLLSKNNNLIESCNSNNTLLMVKSKEIAIEVNSHKTNTDKDEMCQAASPKNNATTIEDHRNTCHTKLIQNSITSDYVEKSTINDYKSEKNTRIHEAHTKINKEDTDITLNESVLNNYNPNNNTPLKVNNSSRNNLIKCEKEEKRNKKVAILN